MINISISSSIQVSFYTKNNNIVSLSILITFCYYLNNQ